MIVKLAGFNVDADNIDMLKNIISYLPKYHKEEIENLQKIEWTPETISASYARISRDPRPIDDLRKEASREIKKARKSNQIIIFDMGHSSIAEHAVFNFDILNISRLAAEYLERSRLVSYTEKSQRYIKIGYDNLIPEEFKTDKGFLAEYTALLNELFEAYNHIHDKLVPYFKELYPEINPESRDYRDIINLAKEDARYILPLSTLTQAGMTINARSLEKMIRKLLSSPLKEVNELADKLYSAVSGHAPSLVKYTKPGAFENKDYGFLKAAAGKKKNKKTADVTVIKVSGSPEENILAGFIVKNSSHDYNTAMEIASGLGKNEKKEIFDNIFKDLNSYDSLQREFEMAEIEFNLVMSATCFAQAKRHRMATIIDGGYSPELGVTIPDSIKAVGLENYFTEKINKIDALYDKALKLFGRPADYVLSNAHRKNVLLKCNFRELVHISRLRSDKHAQWDIRNISDRMTEAVSPYFPIINFVLCGKDKFAEKFKKM